MTKILIVDDDIPATTLLYKVLTAEGFEAIVINESSRALQLARSIYPDLFLLDLMMPEPDGFKLCRQLRDDSNFTETPIIIITALDDKDSKLVAFGAGANDYLTKPYNIKDLAERVRALT
jgi:DNA-binding response OmpR family regulator